MSRIGLLGLIAAADAILSWMAKVTNASWSSLPWWVTALISFWIVFNVIAIFAPVGKS